MRGGQHILVAAGTENVDQADHCERTPEPQHSSITETAQQEHTDTSRLVAMARWG
jgi:hypothetical protein